MCIRTGLLTIEFKHKAKPSTALKQPPTIHSRRLLPIPSTLPTDFFPSINLSSKAPHTAPTSDMAESRALNQFNQYSDHVKDHIITSIYEQLKNLERSAAKSEATQGGHSIAFATIEQKLVELDHRWDVVIDRENPDCLGPVFDPLFDLGPAMAENQNILLEKMNTFQSKLMRQRGKLIAKMERMESNQLQITNDAITQMDFMHNIQVDQHEDAKAQLDNIHGLQSHMMDRLKHVHKVNVEQYETLRAKLEDFNGEQKNLENTLMEKLDQINENLEYQETNLLKQMYDMGEQQTEQDGSVMKRLDTIDTNLEDQQINLMEKMNHMDEDHSELQNNLIERLDNIDTNLEDHKINLMEKMNHMDVEHSERENKLMRMLNQLQEQQVNAQASYSQWSFLVYGSQDRIHDRLEVLEKKMCQMLERIPNVSGAGDNSEERVLTEFRDDLPQIGSEEYDAEVFVAPIELPIDQSAELDAGGNLKALWEFLAPLLVVSMFLSIW